MDSGHSKADEEHARLVRNVAGRVRLQLDLTHAIEDLVAAGFVGLLEAKTRFDPSRGVQFTTFAYYRIRGAIIDFVRKSGNASRRAYDRLKLAEAVDVVSEDVADLRGGSPAQRTDLDGTVRALDESLGRIAAAFVIGCLGQDASPPDPEAEFESADAERRVRDAVDALPARERAIVVGHYFDGKRFDELAAEMGVSKSWTSRIHNRALDLLRKQLGED